MSFLRYKLIDEQVAHAECAAGPSLSKCLSRLLISNTTGEEKMNQG
jgi:hypothetical protein